MICPTANYGTTACKWDVVIPFEPLWEQYKRIIKDRGAIALFASQPFTSLLVTSNLSMYKHEWIWQKDGGSNFANTVREPMKEHESILIFSNGKWTYNKQMQERIGSRKGKVTKSTFNSHSDNYRVFEGRGSVEIPELRVPSSIQRVIRERGLHPTQKPVALLEYMIKTYTLEGETVLDNTMGSGSTGIACINTGRNFIGIEKDECYFKIAKNRIADALDAKEHSL